MSLSHNITFLLKYHLLLLFALIISVFPGVVIADSSVSSTSSVIGQASWYNFRPGLFAASNIYSPGQKVRVYHDASGKYVDVVINDYGPDPKIYPDRVIDLQKEAFAQLAPLGAGVITVRLEPLPKGENLAIISQPVSSSTLAITSTSTKVLSNQTGRDLSKEQAALAQFTKLYGRLPKDAVDWRIIKDLAYNNLKRDLNKEKLALTQFTKLYGRLPKDSVDWQIIKDIAYYQKLPKTNNNFKAVNISNKEAAAAIVLDGDNGQVLWERNATQVLPIASLTKLVAVKTFLDVKPDLDKVVTYSQEDEKEIGKYCTPSEAAMVNLRDGDQVKVRDLVYSALIGSANNAVESLVRLSGLTRDEFINKMNANAKKWGTTSTKFVEPTGLSPDNVSTAKDYALILKNISQDATIKKISTTASYQFSTINTKQSHTIKNTNKLLREGNFSLETSKTGYLTEAGHCLAMAAQQQDTKQHFIVVTLGSPTWSKSYEVASKLLTTALN